MCCPLRVGSCLLRVGVRWLLLFAVWGLLLVAGVWSLKCVVVCCAFYVVPSLLCSGCCVLLFVNRCVLLAVCCCSWGAVVCCLRFVVECRFAFVVVCCALFGFVCC